MGISGYKRDLSRTSVGMRRSGVRSVHSIHDDLMEQAAIIKKQKQKQTEIILNSLRILRVDV